MNQWGRQLAVWPYCQFEFGVAGGIGKEPEPGRSGSGLRFGKILTIGCCWAWESQCLTQVEWMFAINAIGTICNRISRTEGQLDHQSLGYDVK